MRFISKKNIKDIYWHNLLIYAGFFFVLFSSCSSGPKYDQETPTHGSINISVDESFKPVIDSQIKVFESSFPDAKINVHYKPEAECFKDLAQDSTRMIIVTRGLNKKEENFYKDSIHFVPVYGILAYDAVAIIVNNNSKDTILTMKDVVSLLDGTNANKKVVMDGLSSTGTVRYAIDSILKGKPLGKNVEAAPSTEGVIDFVSKNENAVGFIGVSWIGDWDDPQQLSFLQKIKVAAVQCTSCLGETYVRPYVANIYLKRYPLIREVDYILKENWSGVGNNFVNFLQFERGQLIFRRSYLVPGRMSFDVRQMKISN